MPPTPPDRPRADEPLLRCRARLVLDPRRWSLCDSGEGWVLPALLHALAFGIIWACLVTGGAASVFAALLLFLAVYDLTHRALLRTPVGGELRLTADRLSFFGNLGNLGLQAEAPLRALRAIDRRGRRLRLRLRSGEQHIFDCAALHVEDLFDQLQIYLDEQGA